MKNLLVFNFYPAFLPPKNAGEAHLYNFYFELSKVFNITLLSSGALDSELETIWHTNNFVEKRVPKDSALFHEQWQKLSEHAGEGDLSGPTIAECGKNLTELHKAYLECYADSDVIVHEFPFTVDYDLFMGLDDKPRVYNSNNCEYELYKKLHASAPSKEIEELVRNLEIRLLRNADLVMSCGEDDLLLFEQLLQRRLLQGVCISRAMSNVAILRKKSDKLVKRAVFIGSGHLPNVDAAKFIANVLAPACSEITFDVIGNCLPAGDYTTNVVRHGVVDAEIKSRLIAEADIAVNPMLSGSGINLKVLEFVAHGVPVLSTSFGMRGFDFQDGKECILSEAEEFPKTLKKWANNTDALERIAVSAKKLATDRYSWTAIVNKVSALINGLLVNPTIHQQSKPYVLALNDYDPFNGVGGGITRLQGLYSAMAEWSDVVVLCFSKGSSIEVTEVSPRIRCVQIPKTMDQIEEEKYFNSRFHIFADDILALRHTGSNVVLNSIYNVLRRYARIVVCDHPYMVILPSSFGDRFVYSSQNFEYGLKKSLLQWHPDKQSLLEDVYKAERLCVSSSALTIAVSSEDAKSLTSDINTAAPVIVIPNGAGVKMPPTPDDLGAVAKKIKPRSAVFLGSAHMPNVDAANFIIESLAQGCPDVEFHLVGSVCQAVPRDLPSNVKTWGVVSESMKSAVLQLCKIAINPMFSGSGSNVKLADFLANGLHVVSTDFGVRGYPDIIQPHVTVTNLESFTKSVLEVIDDPHIGDKAKRVERQRVSAQHLSMHSLARKFVEHLRDLEKPKKRMLFVTCRYTEPSQGGAESMLAKLIAAVGNSGEFTVDVIAPEVFSINEFGRFGSHYEFGHDVYAPIGLKNVRFARFPVAMIDEQIINKKLAIAWRAQSEFERQLYFKIQQSISHSVLAWGWGYPELSDEGTFHRWGFTECGLHLVEHTTVRIVGFVPRPAVIRVRDFASAELLHIELNPYFDISFEADRGAVEIYISTKIDYSISDPRPLGMYTMHVYLNGIELNLATDIIDWATGDDPLVTYLQMYEAARLSRDRYSVSLTDIRGPHSADLESFLEKYIRNYDIVVTHNSVLRPAVAAISAAKAAKIPSVLIPHAHLDDDFYHFPDVHQSALDADLVLAAPKEACRFYECIGVRRVEYLPAGVDTSVVFSDTDELAFRAIYARPEPFFLVLGRKSGAKGYLHVIREIEVISSKRPIHLVLIGPDDDSVPVTSMHATYLGYQPEEVVRGALKSCIGLINMSSSESFGMVLLESWMAGRPVIVNGNCSAFRDLAVHEENALLVSAETLGAAIERLASDSSLCNRLGAAGKTIVNQYAWDKICNDFVGICSKLAVKK